MLKKMLEYCDPEIRQGEITNYNHVRVDKKTGKAVIYLNPFTDTVLGRLTRLYLNRPDYKNVSLAHELGHVFAGKVYKGTTKRRITAVFGKLGTSGTRYEFSKSRMNKDHPDFLTKYGQEHPEEDFADVFAYLVLHNNTAPDGEMSRRLKAKFELVRSLIAEVGP